MLARVKPSLVIAALLFSAGMPGYAQSVQFLPEIDAHLKLNSFLRAYVQAKNDRDEGVQDQASIGPSVQLYIKPLIKLKRITTFDLDDAKPRALVLELGYRSVTAPKTAPTNRMETILTFHLPAKAGILISDRNRADLDWKSGTFTWRYRNKLTVERTFAVHSYHLIPYVAAEPYYVEKYEKWSTTDVFAGCLFPAGKHVQFNPYYGHANNTGKSPNQQQDSFGFAVYFYFSMEKEQRLNP